MKIIVDRDLCEGNARCVQQAPKVFRTDDNDRLEILIEEPPESMHEAVEAAVALCPRQALRLLDSEPLAAPYVLEYTYQRSTGPVIGRFLAGLRDGRLEGVRTQSGRVLMPPLEYDPDDGSPTGETVPVGPGGVVTAFANGFALVKLDGADTAMLHKLDVKEPRLGMRVYPKWAETRTGSILDLQCFTENHQPISASGGDPVTLFPSFVHLEYTVTAGRNLTQYLRALAEKRIVGGRCSQCQKVYLPRRGSCPTCGIPSEENVEVCDQGTITTFCIIRIPFDAAPFPPPYTAIAVLLDGADMPIFHLLRGGEARMGMRVRAVWAEELTPTLASIRWFEPSGDPDAPFEAIEKHL
jgi:uncharacterized OB-fold protein/ferredoxin